MQQVRFVRVGQVQERRVFWLLEHGVLHVLQRELCEWKVPQRILQRDNKWVPVQHVRFVCFGKVSKRRVCRHLQRGLFYVLQPKLRKWKIQGGQLLRDQ